MVLKSIGLKDKNLFNKFLNLRRHGLSVYSFANIYIWKALFDIRWSVIDDSLCVFFKDKLGCFLYLSPLGAKNSRQAVEEAFKIMDKYNQNKDASRIENIEAEDLVFYRALRLICREKYPEYLCARQDLAQLQGNKFKSKRASCNYFTKNYKFLYRRFCAKDKDACLRLYNRWMKERKVAHQDKFYQGMLEDSRACLKVLSDNYRNLNLVGRIIEVGARLKGFTFGFKINPEEFCVIYEVTDLSLKGSAQFIFRQLCRELKDFKYINIMDDSGLENLRKVKLSYHPLRTIPAYIATRDA